MKIFSKDKEMRKNEVVVTVFDTICIIAAVVCLALWFKYQTEVYSSVAVFGVLSALTSVMLSIMLFYRFTVNKDANKQ